MDISELGPNLLRTLIDHLPDAIYVKDRQCRFVLDNLAHRALLGVKSADETLGKKAEDFFPPALAAIYDADDRQVLDSGDPLLGREEPIIDSSGNPRWLVTSKVPLHNAESDVIALVGISRDITRRRKAEQERDRFFRLTLDLLCITGFDGYFKQLNPAWEATLGYSTEELMASPAIDFVHPDDRSITSAENLRTRSGLPTSRFENRLRCKDGSYKWFSWSASPLPEAQLVYGVALDITERKQAEQRLIAANAELARSESALLETMAALRASHEDLIQAQLSLIQAEKMDSVGRLAAGVAHEVKNPLAILLMGVDFLDNSCIDSDNARNVIRAMRDAIRRAESIVHGLVDFSAERQLDLHERDIRMVIAQSLLLVKHELLAARVQTRLELDEHLPPVMLDENKMHQVFINVFINAAHAMAGGGELKISARSSVADIVERSEGSRMLSGLRPGDSVVVVKVEDTGHGIAPDKLASVFDPFFTTKPPGKGTGLGMTVSKKIVELHGGSIDIRNRPEGGVAVTFVLPEAEKNI